MIKISDILKMPCGEQIGGGFVLTVKTTKKWVELPQKNGFIFTVVLLDSTGEMLADFKCPSYSPIIKGEQVKIIVAQVQAADPSSNKIVLREGKKLYVDQFEKLTQTLSEYEGQLVSCEEDWNRQIKGKIRHGLICSYIQSGKDIPQPSYIEKLVDWIFAGEQK